MAARMVFRNSTWRVLIMSLTVVPLVMPGTSHITPNRTLQLGVLLPYTGSWPVGYGISGAVPLAVNYVRTDPSFAYFRQQGYDLNYTIIDCPCDEGLGLTAFTRLLFTSQPPMDVYIGPACDNVCEPAGFISLTEKALLITYACGEPIISEISSIQRTVAPFHQIGPIIAAFLQKYRWTRVAILEGGDDTWQQVTDAVVEYLASNTDMQVNVYHFFEVSRSVTNLNETRLNTVAEAASENMVFIVLTTAEDLPLFISIVNQLQMLNGKYAFLTVNMALDDSFWDNAYASYGINKTDITGWFNLSPYYPTDNWTNAFLSDVTNHSTVPKALQATLPHHPLVPAQVDSHVFPLYDAIILYATAVNNSVAAGDNHVKGAELDRIYRTNIYFNGINGLTYATPQGDVLPYFAISNVRDGIFVKVAQYVKTGAEFIDTPVQWPGGGFVPVLGRPVCGWSNEYCTRDPIVNIVLPVLIVTVCVAVAVTIALAFIRHRNYIKRLESEAWKLAYNELSFCSAGSSKTLSFTRSMMSTDSLSDEMMSSSALPNGPLRLAFYNSQLVIVKHLKKPTINVTKTLVAEINQVRLLRHTNVVSLVGVCVEPGHVCVVMGYCSKGSLHDVLKSRHVTLDKIFTTAFINDIVQGMVYLHATPIQYHGNLKSTNVLIDSRWTCKLADFGQAELRAGENNWTPDGSTDQYELLWTSPELLREFGDNPARQHGTRAGDVYAFGIIMQEIFTRKPLHGLKQATAKGRNPAYRPSVSVQDAGSPGMLELMMSCCDEDPKNRPSFETIRNIIRRITRGKKINIVDQMTHMLEKHSAHLEELVQERTRQLTEEQKKTEGLLNKILPKSVAEALKLGRTVDPENYASVTISFSDIVGFTAMAATSTPLQVVQFLNDLYTCFDSIIEKYDVYKVETIGDAYMVASGVPVRNGNRHAGEIATLDLELLSEIRTFRIRHLPDKQLQLRLGIHSGPVVAGVVGVTMPRYCLFGDTVNTASRMESSGLALKIHVSAATKQILDELTGYYFTERGPITTKGKGTIVTYFLEGKDGFNRLLPDPALAAPLSEHEFK